MSSKQSTESSPSFGLTRGSDGKNRDTRTGIRFSESSTFSTSPERANAGTVRILVADDHPVVRHGLRTLLGSRSDWEIIEEAEDGVEAVELAERLQPDVVLLDVSMPQMGGLEACRRIRKTVPKAEVLMVTQHDSAQMMREATDAGARGYVVKSDAARDLLAAVEAVSQHRSFFAHSPQLASDSESCGNPGVKVRNRSPGRF